MNDTYHHTLDALGLCITAGIPVILWGDPGEGKTSMIESATARGVHVETVILSQSEPSDLAGLPIVSPAGDVVLAPPIWARRLAEHDGPAICFFDEFSTATPALQAAALRVLTHREVGNLRLPRSVSFVAAANPVEVSAAGWDLAAPTSSRFVHLDFAMTAEVFTRGSVTGQWPALPGRELPADHTERVAQEMATVCGFLRARPNQLSVIPQDHALRSRAFPTPRTWQFAAELSALARAHDLPDEVTSMLVAGAIGDATAHEYLSWRTNLDLPDPAGLLDGSATIEFSGLRADRVFVVLQALVAALGDDPGPERWTTAVELCCQAAHQAGLDAAVPAVRALVAAERRPAGAPVPAAISIFAPALAEAGLL
ncbi:AAA family ATPase [Gordonia sp. (in: high G+C Gram-positive bacteria)]|uniref:AAA family ATPase n=1 Tax=Gordonia sp. (in: high G+C Gram-positive bacteria) TaxID=84139 RepID=UPI0035295C9C